MIGNDIIDLDLTKIQSNWQRPKFLEKIFTLKERNFIQKAENPELEVWKLWRFNRKFIIEKPVFEVTFLGK